MRIPIGPMVGCLLWILVQGGYAAQAEIVDPKAIAAAGEKTSGALSGSSASWIAETTLSNGSIIRVTVLAGTGTRATTTSVIANGQTVVVQKIIVRDGFWYVTDSRGRSKYRPLEAPADTPNYTLALNRSQLMFVASAEQLNGWKPEEIDASIVTFHQPLAANQAQQVQAAIDQFEAFPRLTGKQLSPENQTLENALKDLRQNGNVLRIDVGTGIIVDFKGQNVRTRITDFKLAGQIDESALSVEHQDWQDYSDDPTSGDMNDLVMIAHDPIARVTLKGRSDLDSRLMDVKTGRFRRIPFPGASSVPGCFLKDRRHVIVSGDDPQTGVIRPFLIDLKTRKCDPLGGQFFTSGITMGADVSPNGNTVAVGHRDVTGAVLNQQVFLVDLQTGHAKPLGAPLDTVFPEWTSDGQNLMLLTRKYTDIKSPSINSLATMDMDGKITELRNGDSPTLLADRQTILFQDPATDLWQTCDLQGQNVKLFADGLKGYGFPSPASDGKRLFMMHFIPGHLPEPIILQVGDSSGKPVTTVDGLWAMPKWR